MITKRGAAGLLAGCVLLGVACGKTASDEPPATSDAGGTTGDASTAPGDAATRDAKDECIDTAHCVPANDAGPGPLGQWPACHGDPECNEDPTVSAVWGTCFNGICMCKQGFYVQANGKCGPALPPACNAQPHGTCTQEPAVCPAGSLGTEDSTNMSCGDLIPAACCFPESACVAPQSGAPGVPHPIEMECCAPNDALHPPICVNGWQTCAHGDSPVIKGGGCG